MANEINFGYATGKTNLTYGVYQPDGTVRTAAGTSLTETSGTGYYHATDTSIDTGDIVITKEGTTVVGVGEYNPAVALSEDGLDSVSVVEPTGVASNFREMIVQLYRRFFGKTTLSASEMLNYKEDETTVATTQVISESSTLQTQGEAS